MSFYNVIIKGGTGPVLPSASVHCTDYSQFTLNLTGKKRTLNPYYIGQMTLDLNTICWKYAVWKNDWRLLKWGKYYYIWETIRRRSNDYWCFLGQFSGARRFPTTNQHTPRSIISPSAASIQNSPFSPCNAHLYLLKNCLFLNPDNPPRHPEPSLTQEPVLPVRDSIKDSVWECVWYMNFSITATSKTLNTKKQAIVQMVRSHYTCFLVAIGWISG